MRHWPRPGLDVGPVGGQRAAGVLERALEAAGQLLPAGRPPNRRSTSPPGSVFHGWAEARGGDPSRGEQRIRAALAEMDATGTQFRPFALGLLAEARLLAGDPAQAGDTLRLATEEAGRLGEYLYDPQLRARQARLRSTVPGAPARAGRTEAADGIMSASRPRPVADG